MMSRLAVSSFLVCTIWTAAAFAEPRALLESLKIAPSLSAPVAESRGTSAVSSGVNGTVGCVVYTKAEVKQITGRRYRRHVGFICFSDLGDVLGSVVTRKGVPACTVFGTYDPFVDCIFLSGCNFPSSLCS
jgi:hypothetical protein